MKLQVTFVPKVEQFQNAAINIGWVRLFPKQWANEINQFLCPNPSSVNIKTVNLKLQIHITKKKQVKVGKVIAFFGNERSSTRLSKMQ